MELNEYKCENFLFYHKKHFFKLWIHLISSITFWDTPGHLEIFFTLHMSVPVYLSKYFMELHESKVKEKNYDTEIVFYILNHVILSITCWSTLQMKPLSLWCLLTAKGWALTIEKFLSLCNYYLINNWWLEMKPN